MKILFYTGTFTHDFYKQQFRFFPNDWEIVASTPELTASGLRRDFAVSRWRSNVSAIARDFGLRVYEFFNVPKLVSVKTDADLVYAAQYLIKNKPFVCDFEHAASFSWYNQKLFAKPSFQRKLKQTFSNRNCRLILPWTNAAKESLVKNLDCSEFIDKVKVIYPAIEPKNAKKIKHKGVNLLFVGGAFVLKGGVESVLAFEKLKKDFDCNLTVISKDIPAGFVEQHPEVTFKSKVSMPELDEEYRKADVFVMPTHMDTFGFVFLEAMAYGVPCVGAKHFAVPEIIEDGKTGFVVSTSGSLFDENYAYRYNMLKKREADTFFNECLNPSEDDINELYNALHKLVKSSSLRSKMSKNCLKVVGDGKFSAKNRVSQIEKLFGKVE